MVPFTTGINTVSMVNSRYYVAIAICVDVLPVPESDILLYQNLQQVSELSSLWAGPRRQNRGPIT
jgi:hypothetical protein